MPQKDDIFIAIFTINFLDFYSEGKIPDFLGHYIGDNNWFKMNKSAIIEEPLYKAKCDMFDSIDLYLNV